MTNLLKLQNGSDVRGVACEGVVGEDINLTEDIVTKITYSFTKWISKKQNIPCENLKIAVGHDSRITAEQLKKAAIKGINLAKGTAVDCKMETTPAMFMSLLYENLKFNGSFMLTASHLPFNRNGIKFFEPTGGGIEKEELKKVLEYAEQIKGLDMEKCEEKVEEIDLIDIYATSIKNLIKNSIDDKENFEKPLQNMHIVVDAGNGAGGFFATKVLKDLGCNIEGSCFLNPDGYFPNHVPNPEDKKAMESIKNAVISSKADLGLIFDTDVDRMSAVLSNGAEINKDALIAMMSAILKEKYETATIVTDSVTSDNLTDFLEKHLGFKHFRYMRGYKNVINKCKELNEEGIISPLAIETSGHGAFSENFYLDDGAYMAVMLIIALRKMKDKSQNLEDLIKDFIPPCESLEFRFKLLGEDFKNYGDMVLSQFEKNAKKTGYKIVTPSYEGVRLKFDGDFKGWALLRKSLHDPNMPLNIEGVNKGDAEKIKNTIKNLLQGFDELDISALN